jgi:hypothetical protein
MRPDVFGRKNQKANKQEQYPLQDGQEQACNPEQDETPAKRK